MPPATTAELTAYNVGRRLTPEQCGWLAQLGPYMVGVWVTRGVEDAIRGMAQGASPDMEGKVGGQQ